MWSLKATALLALAPFAQLVLAQTSTPTTYEDPDTGIIFDTWKGTGADITFGVALPSDALDVDATELIGYLKCGGSGWCGLSFNGIMTNSLLLAAYPQDGEVLTALMWATGYEMPDIYAGDAEITQISSSITDDGFELIYRCQGCLAWDHNGATGKASTSTGGMMLGWALAAASPTNPECPQTMVVAQHDTQFIFRGTFSDNVVNEAYEEWAALATNVVEGDCGGGSDPDPTTTTALPTGTGIPVPTDASYDYIVVGGGAGGLPMADRLSEAGHKVLLIEKGPVSTGEWGGEMKPEWLEGTDLTRFDVPGLCNQIWADSSGIACRDTDQMAGCLLGGGTAINAGLFWRPKAADWDYNFPEGWKADDMAAAEERVFSRIPGTRFPSTDGKRYLDQGFQVVSGALSEAGWTEINFLEEPNKKKQTFGHGPFMFNEHAERGGPLDTYLKTAASRSNFDMWTNTQVKRVNRERGHATSVEVTNYNGDGYVGTVSLTEGTGRVILSAGTFGSAKLLMRSGIGPQDQLEVVAASADGPDMIDESEWIKLPVGYNLEDHTNTDTVIAHPDVVFYDFYEAYDDPIPADRDAYLDERVGILTQAAPNIGPVFFDEITGTDGITRSLQWTARVEPSLGHTNLTAITMSQYLGRGAVSRGRMTITSSLSTVVSDVPYLKNQQDVEAVIKGIENLQEAMAGYEGIEWLSPSPDETAREFVENMAVSPSNRRANHWIGTNKMGTHDGRQNNGDAVVDLNARVWGTDNIFVVDASIFPGMITPNPTAYIITVAERASERILAMDPSKPGSKYAQCGGQTWTGSYQCEKGLTCKKVDNYYSQCL
ncbi:cellobiose dehydrogenase-like protein [Emericellopsis atlantica]|uniref:Cellobiose dehydrogenase-like protein n=1 Tax=Emericellopsis atlantica TaxID=2614577 RepID=A0A9P7ZPX2_9HYPO|nr:cellobiose dehydrogenase-like protein [Emericellopsis atlantica]KAG9255545.1 cellobiose dehydrogenase-like protein [Emericellopsis atlantica]